MTAAAGIGRLSRQRVNFRQMASTQVFGVWIEGDFEPFHRLARRVGKANRVFPVFGLVRNLNTSTSIPALWMCATGPILGQHPREQSGKQRRVSGTAGTVEWVQPLSL